MIRNPNDIQEGAKKIRMLIAGYPGIGKSTLALSAPNPLHIVIVFHATEEKDGDNTRLRIKVEGQTKNNVWEPMDLGGFVEIYGNDRTIGFSNCERYFAKGTRGISGIRKIRSIRPSSTR